MKRRGVCPKCESDRVLHVRHVADRTSGRETHVGKEAPTAARLALRNEEKNALIGKYTAAVSEGDLEAYVCGSCGYVEHYLIDVGQITVDGEHVVHATKPPTLR